MKIAIPTIRKPTRRPKTVRRLRLLDLIHENIQRKLTFLCAPAGYGKTTLLIDFAEDTDARVAWCRIGPEDEGLAYFYQHMILALREVYPKFGEGLEEISFEETTASPRALAIDLVNEIATSIDDFTLLVLDDYHVISEELKVVAFVEHFLELLPDNLRLIIGSRSIYGIPSAWLYVNEELAVLSADDLRFRVSEVKDLVRRHFHIHLSDDQAEQITSQSEGWITSILLAIRDGMPSSAIPKLAGAREQVYEYLAKEVYTHLSEDIKRFLVYTAICDQFDISLANYVLEIENARKIIKFLEDSNLFVFSVTDGEGTNYQYHQLFRDFLETLFHEKPGIEQAGVHRRVADWYERQGDPIRSIHHHLLAGDRERAAGIMDRHAMSLYISGQVRTLQEWFQALSQPPDLKCLAPDLVLNWVKIKTNQGKLEDCLALLDLVEPVFSAQERYENLANLLVVRGMILRFLGEFEPAVEIARRTQVLVEVHNLDRYYAYQAERLEGLGLYHTGHPKQALVACNEALRGFRELNAHRPSDRLKHDLVMVLTDIGMMALLSGDIFNAQGSFEEALSISLSMHGNQGDLATCANNQAYLSFLMGDFRQAWQYYQQALSAAEQVDWTSSIVQVLNGQAEILTLFDEYEKATAALQRAMETAQSVPGGQVFPATYQEMAELEKLAGHYSQAMFYLREAAHVSKVDIQNPEYRVRFGGVYLSMEQWQLARETLEPAVQSLEGAKMPSQSRSLGSYYLAEACFRMGDKEKALPYLRQALSEAARLGYDSFLVNAVHLSPELFREMGKHWKNNHLKTILTRAAEMPSGYNQLLLPETELHESTRYVLQVRALGDYEIRLDGEILPLTNWQSARARALFFYLLDQGRVKREDIAVQFWPEFSNAKVNSNFHATLWRVRNALGRKNIITFDGQYYAIQEQADIFYDVREFEELISQLSRCSDVERRSIFTQAIDLYRGDFLPDIDLSWSDMRRSELREKNLFVLEQFAVYEFENQHLEDAKQLYEKAIEIDPYEDFLHLGLVKCLVKLKTPTAAKTHFEKYRLTLLKDLGHEPMQDLQAFVDEI